MPPSYAYGQCVVHMPVSHATVTAFIAQLLPSSALSGCAAQPQAGQVSCHVCSAVLKLSRWLWLMPSANIEPQQSS